jgi:UDP-N-acetylglucosamine--N-acetylmuramyl-(pentapeptide) pyrophosphoryl-undecaprenol N-acetylglucosamine transferase
MAAIYGSCDLLITRSGAVTCSEIMTVGRYAILVPLSHGNGEQIKNAQALVRQGRAVAIANNDFDKSWLVNNLDQAIRSAQSLGHSPSDMHRGAATRIAQLALAEVDK